MGSAVRSYSPRQTWHEYPITFRAKEMRQVANWIRTNTSGSVIGLDGAGKSDFVSFLCHRVDALQQYLPASFPPVHPIILDLNTLPEPSLSALYRVILRTFYEKEDHFTDEAHEIIHQLYHEVRSTLDPFLSQSALRELIRYFQRQSERVVIILDRFDAACHLITPEMGDSLRGLRDSFKRTLSYISCMRLDYAYLQGPESLGDLYRLLDGQICYLGPLTEEDAKSTICRRTNHTDLYPDERTMYRLLTMSGRYPALLRVVWQWWLTTEKKPAPAQWQSILLEQSGVQRRLNDIWMGLTQEEQNALAMYPQLSTVEGQVRKDNLSREQDQIAVNELFAKGIYVEDAGVLRIVSSLTRGICGANRTTEPGPYFPR